MLGVEQLLAGGEELALGVERLGGLGLLLGGEGLLGAEPGELDAAGGHRGAEPLGRRGAVGGGSAVGRTRLDAVKQGAHGTSRNEERRQAEMACRPTKGRGSDVDRTAVGLNVDQSRMTVASSRTCNQVTA